MTKTDMVRKTVALSSQACDDSKEQVVTLQVVYGLEIVPYVSSSKLADVHCVPSVQLCGAAALPIPSSLADFYRTNAA